MKRKSLLKLSVVIGLSLMLILTLSRFTLAADFDWENATVTTGNTAGNTSNTVENTTTNTATNTGTNTVENVVPSTTRNTTTNTTVDNTTRNTTNNVTANTSNEAMPYTGIEDTNSIVALIAVVGVVVAIYSYKKINEYKNV